MSDEREKTSMLSVAGVVQVTPLPSGRSAVRVSPSAGWLSPCGISGWESELSFISRAEMTEALARALRGTLPREQIAEKRYPLASLAVATVPFLALSGNLAADVRKQGIRVHTVGVDRVSAGFYYFVEGGAGDSVQVQGNLVEMLAPSLAASSTNADIAALVKDIIDRLLVRLSGGAVSELDVELASALPRLSRDGTGLADIDLDAFEARARTLADASARWEVSAHRLVEALADADASGRDAVPVPLYGEAKREVSPSVAVHVGGRTLTLEGAARWTVRGAPREEPAIRAPRPAAAHADGAETRAAATGGALDKVAPPATAEKAPAAAAFAKSEPPAAQVAPQSPAAQVAPQSPAAQVAPQNPAVQVAPQSPAAQVATAQSKAAEKRAPEPSQAPLTPSPIVSIGAPSPRVESAGITASPIVSFGPETAPSQATSSTGGRSASSEWSTSRGAASPTASGPAAAPVAASPTASSTTDISTDPGVGAVALRPSAPEIEAPAHGEPAGQLAARAAAAKEAPLATAEQAARAAAEEPARPAPKEGRPPREVRPAAAMAPSDRRGPISGIGLVVLLLLAAIAYSIGRFIRHRYLHMP